MRAVFSTFIILLGISSAIQAAEMIDVGPDVGTNIPANFNGQDAKGNDVTYADVAGERGLVLGFVRSASWCPFCQTQMKDLQNIAADLKGRGYELAVMSYDAPKVLDQFAKKQNITYTLLSDDGSEMINALGIRETSYKEDSMAYGVPKPVIFIIDSNGKIEGKLAMEGYRDRPPLEDVMAEVNRIIGANS